MKAFRITSTEYHANIPSVFLFVNGEYFGDTGYAMRDKFPQKVEHWNTATCADDGRYFKVEQVDMPNFLLDWLRETNEELTKYRNWLKALPNDESYIKGNIYGFTQAQVKLIKRL